MRNTDRKNAVSISRSSRYEVLLVRMPYAPLECPSLGLGMLNAQLTRAGIPSEVIYADLLFTEAIGLHTYQMLAYSSRHALIGEWTFSGAAFPGFEPESFTFLKKAAKQFCHNARAAKSEAHVNAVIDSMRKVRSYAPDFVNRLAEMILEKQPAIVGCSSMFQQQTASLAILRRIKELNPAAVTLMGGANCEGEMGARLVLEFPWVDIAFSGEADGVIHELCRDLIRHGPSIPLEKLPQGALNRESVLAFRQRTIEGSEIPRAMVEQLDDLPEPDYDAYFAALDASSYKDIIRPGLLLETSRGCWWGEKKQCSFCGLNGRGLRYRSKSPERALSEFEHVSGRYGTTDIALADCVMSKEYFDSVFPELVRRGAPYRIFYEVRSDLDQNRLRLLAEAGIRWLQPGIEALHDGLLRLMNKGVRAADNVRFLKYARKFGIRLQWNLLVGIPGEEDRWHSETAALLPLLFHLEPVRSVWFVRFDRFSAYHRNSQKFGLRLLPASAYKMVYPVSVEVLEELAYYFSHVSSGGEDHLPQGVRVLVDRLREWHDLHTMREPPVLTMEDEGSEIHIYDTRPCALQERLVLKGIPAEVYRACEGTVSKDTLTEKAKQNGWEDMGAGDIVSTVQELKDKKLLVELGNYLISLAVPGSMASLEPWENSPYGFAPVLDFRGVMDESGWRNNE